jgi:sulfite reductase (NADPH) hemoprotein beta-component
MYRYDSYDQQIVDERVEQFRDQVRRRLAGEITEDEFKPLRLQNGLYMQLHAYMLRIAIPYGLLSSTQLRALAAIARRYDRGYGHFTTRQNIQLNWPKLTEMPDLLADLAKVEMHAIQTSGNCIRNITSDHLAGVAPDELEDPRPTCEVIRQWSTFHPEFAYLPRKFKIAVTGSPVRDRAAIKVHDIGVQLVRDASGAPGYAVYVGGGLGRTPRIGRAVREFVPRANLLSYLEAVLRVYNRWGRRDNKYKARIKILVDSMGDDGFREEVEAEWAHIRDTAVELTQAEFDRVAGYFTPPPYDELPDAAGQLLALSMGPDRELGRFVRTNVLPHKVRGYAAVVISLKPIGRPPGDATSEQMEAIADLADSFGYGRAVVLHTQNLLLPDIRVSDVPALWQRLRELDLATPNHDTATDVIACPGLDYCSLANARSIPVAQRIQTRLEALDELDDVGPLSIKISGCINACGHHHVGNIGILGIDKQGEEFYQLTLGGSPFEDAAIGKIVGPAFSSATIVTAVERCVSLYLERRAGAEETFIEFVRRVGLDAFKERLYAHVDQAS